VATKETVSSAESPAPAGNKGTLKAAAWIAVTVVLLVLIAVNARMGAVSPRIRNL